MLHNGFDVFFQGYMGETRSVFLEYLRLFLELLKEEVKERMDQLLTMTRNQISAGKQMEGQMDRDCETIAAVSRVCRKITDFIQQHRTDGHSSMTYRSGKIFQRIWLI